MFYIFILQIKIILYNILFLLLSELMTLVVINIWQSKKLISSQFNALFWVNVESSVLSKFEQFGLNAIRV